VSLSIAATRSSMLGRYPDVELRLPYPESAPPRDTRDDLGAGLRGGGATTVAPPVAEGQSDRPADSPRCAGQQRDLALRSIMRFRTTVSPCSSPARSASAVPCSPRAVACKRREHLSRAAFEI